MKRTVCCLFFFCTSFTQEIATELSAQQLNNPVQSLTEFAQLFNELPDDLAAELNSAKKRNCISCINSIAQITNSQLPFVIDQPGIYCVNENLTPLVNLNAQPIITIATSNVILNLNNRALVGGPNTTTGILINNQSNVTIVNGFLFNFARAGISIDPRADVRSISITVKNVAFFNCGVALNANTVRDLYIKNCFSYLSSIGFFLGQNNNTLMQNCAAISLVNSQNRNAIGFSLQNNVNLSCSNCFALGNSATGFLCNGLGPVEFKHCTARANFYGFNCSTTAGRVNTNRGFVFNKCLAQTNSNDGFFLSGSGHSVQNCSAVYNLGDGYQISGDGHSILNNIAQFNSQVGILLSAGSTRCQVRDNTLLVNTNGLINNGTNNRIYANYASDNTNNNYTGVPNVATSPTATDAINCTANIAN